MAKIDEQKIEVAVNKEIAKQAYLEGFLKGREVGVKKSVKECFYDWWDTLVSLSINSPSTIKNIEKDICCKTCMHIGRTTYPCNICSLYALNSRKKSLQNFYKKRNEENI
jgi:hypothetical protein